MSRCEGHNAFRPTFRHDHRSYRTLTSPVAIEDHPRPENEGDRPGSSGGLSRRRDRRAPAVRHEAIGDMGSRRSADSSRPPVGRIDRRAAGADRVVRDRRIEEKATRSSRNRRSPMSHPARPPHRSIAGSVDVAGFAMDAARLPRSSGWAAPRGTGSAGWRSARRPCLTPGGPPHAIRSEPSPCPRCGLAAADGPWLARHFL